MNTNTLSANPEANTTLGRLSLGTTAVIQGVSSANAELRQKLLTMGLIKNTKVRVTDIAPLGDPIGILVRGFKLCLRRSEAESVMVAKTSQTQVSQSQAA